MTPKDLAARLNGREYGREVLKGENAEAASHGLVIVFGYSDDGMELRGAADDEIGAYDGTTVLFTRAGLLKNECDDDECPHFERLKKGATPLRAKWNSEGYSWTCETAIPHETFEIMDGSEKFCRGIVFALADVP